MSLLWFVVCYVFFVVDRLLFVRCLLLLTMMLFDDVVCLLLVVA